MRKFLFGLLLLGAAACASPDGLATPLQVQRIWDLAPHSAFTGMTDYRGNLYCCFREANSHVPKKTGVPGDNGQIRVLVSGDGQRWDSLPALTLAGIDLRDPSIVETPDGRLMIVMGGSRYADGKFLGGTTYVSFSDPATGAFSEPVPIVADSTQFPGKKWVWRVRWHGDTGYGVLYEDDRASLVKTADGIRYDAVAAFDLDSLPNETDLLFGPGDEMILLVRREAKGANGLLGRSKPPYTEWQWHNTGIRLGGPRIFRLPDGRVIAGSRDHADAEAHVGLYEVGSGGQLQRLCRLPSGGDCSYPDFVIRGDTLFMSYYSAHEGHDAIYLASFDLR